MFELPDLPYKYESLEPYIDKKTMTIHHDRHHAGYVKKLNAALEGNSDLVKLSIDELMSDLNKIPENIRTTVTNNGGGHINHSLFWKIMSPNHMQKPSGELEKSINSTFGEYESLVEKFTKAALGRFGSGWAWLTSDKGNLSITDSANQDTPVSNGKTPILGIDVWEHAYYLKYQNKRADYVAAWWNVVNWKQVEKNFSNSLKG